MMNTNEDNNPPIFDTIIVGAGISGIGAAYYFQRDCPNKSYTILEGRAQLGGTWDLFKYPGIRSDSDLYTFAYEFKPWRSRKSIASAQLILDYLNETADEYQIREHIQFSTQVRRAEWCSEESLWTVTTLNSESGETSVLKAHWIFSATGYYDYDEGFLPKFNNLDSFDGELVHPQHWPENFSASGKKVVVIGSGATAVTIVPELAKDADHVTLLQRTPTYMMNLPTGDPIANAIKAIFSEQTAHRLIRQKNVFLHRLFWRFSQRFPNAAKRFLIRHVGRQLPDGYDVDKHFTPPYNPWDQRLCAVTDGDLFKAIRRGDVDIQTDHIERFTSSGLKLKSGEEIKADTVVTATGLNIKLMGGVDIIIDGKPIDFPNTVTYKGAMLSGVPNFCFAVGYTNASWTLKIGLLCEYFCRVFNHMEAQNFSKCVPEVPTKNFPTSPLLDFSAGYVQRSLHLMPKKGESVPWDMSMNYGPDVKFFREGRIDDEFLVFQSN
ncbi:MAG: NAD(P)/FAD-dependent oxidoreductase [Pseudomonadales bacterium]|jgi:cation diffusion facilitator CzcD-associated flavoprotein CzcO